MMTVNLNKILVFCCFILIISCTGQSNNKKNVISNPAKGAWQDQQPAPLQFKLEQTFGDNKENMLSASYSIAGPVADSLGNVYFIDGKKGVMYSFDPNGNLRWEKGKKGKGPGDFKRPQGLVTDGKHLYTANVSGSRIDQFDLQGKLINSVSLEDLDTSFNSVVGVSDSLLVTSSTVMGEIATKVNIFSIKDDSKKITHFKIGSTRDLDLPKGLGSSFNIQIADTLIAAGNIKDYALQFYDFDGEKVKTVRRDFDKLMRPGFMSSGNSRSIRGFGRLNAPVQLSENYYLSSLSWPTNVADPDEYLEKSMDEDKNVPKVTYKNALDLYNKNGEFLYTLEGEESSPAIGSIAYVDADGKVYTKLNDPYPQIRRYSVAIAPPN